ncbi:unnamed protein product, partial [Heterotrigona itama]
MDAFAETVTLDLPCALETSGSTRGVLPMPIGIERRPLLLAESKNIHLVVQNGLEILTFLADRMGHDFKPYISTIIQPTIDRLDSRRNAIKNIDDVCLIGDSKDATREKAQLVLLKIMEKGCMSPQQLLDRLRPAFNHKNAKLREEALILLTTTLNEHGADEMILSGVIPSIVKLLSDPSEKVRETALNTLADIYRHVGERLRVDLQRKHNVPQANVAFLEIDFSGKWWAQWSRRKKIKREYIPTLETIEGSRLWPIRERNATGFFVDRNFSGDGGTRFQAIRSFDEAILHNYVYRFWVEASEHGK